MRPSHERLKPATPVALVEGPGFSPRFPWKWVIGVLLFGAIAIGAFVAFEHRKADRLRTEISQRLETGLAPGVKRYREHRSKLEGWVLAAGKENPPATLVDPRLDLAALHKAAGLYLRVRSEDTASAKGVEAGAKRMHPDAITRCLGVAPVSLKGFYDQGAFLMPAWLDAVKKETESKRLAVLQSDLALRVSRDLPGLLASTQAQYFLLAVERGKTRKDSPVDVFLWDMRTGSRLLALRTTATGEFITVHMGAGPRTKPPEGSGAGDCSVAMQIKDAVDAARGVANGEGAAGPEAAPSGDSAAAPAAP